MAGELPSVAAAPSRRVGQNPVPENGDPRADARQVGLRAPDAPADDAAEEPAAVLPPHHQRASRVALKCKVA